MKKITIPLILLFSALTFSCSADEESQLSNSPLVENSVNNNHHIHATARGRWFRRLMSQTYICDFCHTLKDGYIGRPPSPSGCIKNRWGSMGGFHQWRSFTIGGD